MRVSTSQFILSTTSISTRKNPESCQVPVITECIGASWQKITQATHLVVRWSRDQSIQLLKTLTGTHSRLISIFLVLLSFILLKDDVSASEGSRDGPAQHSGWALPCERLQLLRTESYYLIYGLRRSTEELLSNSCSFLSMANTAAPVTVFLHSHVSFEHQIWSWATSDSPLFVWGIRLLSVP